MLITKKADHKYFRVDYICKNLVPMTEEEWENEVISYRNLFTLDKYTIGDHYTKRFLFDGECWYIEEVHSL